MLVIIGSCWQYQVSRARKKIHDHQGVILYPSVASDSWLIKRKICLVFSKLTKQMGKMGWKISQRPSWKCFSFYENMSDGAKGQNKCAFFSWQNFRKILMPLVCSGISVAELCSVYITWKWEFCTISRPLVTLGRLHGFPCFFSKTCQQFPLACPAVPQPNASSLPRDIASLTGPHHSNFAVNANGGA